MNDKEYVIFSMIYETFQWLIICYDFKAKAPYKVYRQ